MPSNVIDRRVIREAIAALLDAKFDATWDIFSYGTVTFNGKARNIVVASLDADRPDRASNDSEISDSVFWIAIGVFILYANDDEGWTPQNSQDALDLGEKYVTDCLKDNRDGNGITKPWYRLSRDGRSSPNLTPDEAGPPYRYEIINAKVEIV